MVKLPLCVGLFSLTLKEHSFDSGIEGQRNRNSFSLFLRKSTGRSF